MAAEKRGASFNPDEASGGFDKGRVTITKASVDTFTAKTGKTAGQSYVNLNLVFDRADGAGEIPVSFLIGSTDEWTPNSTHTEAIPTREDGKFWNKSDLVQFMVSLVNAGFPKTRMGSDFSVLVGLDIDVERVTTQGTHKDKEGKDRPNTMLKAMKVYTSPADLASGAYSKNVKASSGAKSAGTKPNTTVKPSVPVASTEDVADYAKALVVQLIEAAGGVISREDLGKKAYIQITKDKRATQRQAITALLTSDEFIADLASEGLVVDDGENLAAAA